MRKSQLKRLKKDAEEAWRTLWKARQRPDAIRKRYAALPERIADQIERVRDLRDAEEQAMAELTKPLEDYARGRDGTYANHNAHRASSLKYQRTNAEDYLEMMQTERAQGVEGKLADAEQAIEDAELAFKTASHTLCQYAVFYARQRRDIDLVWTEEDEGEWTLDGTVAGLFDGKARKIGMKKLILYLIEPHSQRNESGGEDEFEREVKAKSWDGNGTYRLHAKDLYRGMTGLPTNSYVDVEGCTVQVRRLRKWLRLCGPVIELNLPDRERDEDGNPIPDKWGYREKIDMRAWPDGFRSHVATWKHVLRHPEAHIELQA